jgi:lysozyme
MTPAVQVRARASIMKHEGLMLAAYDDATGRVVQPGHMVKGWITVGYGRNLIGRGITLPEAEYLLANDLSEVEAELNRRLPEWRRWAEPRQWAIFELGFNLGVARFIAEWPTTVAHLRAGRFDRVAGILSGSKWRSQVGDSRALPIIRAFHRGVWT